MRLLRLACFFLVVSTPALADNSTRVTSLFASEPVATTGSVVKTVDASLLNPELASLFLACSSASGTADVKIEVAFSADGSTFTPYDVVVSSTLTGFPSNAEGLNRQSLDAFDPLAASLRFRVTGVASNPADSVCTVDLVARD